MNNTQWLPVLTIALLASAPALAQHDHSEHEHNGHDHEDHSDHQDHSDHDHSGHNHSDHAQHGDEGPSGLSSEDRETLTGETLYTCSMHPQVRSDNPDDRCPICGMALVPVEQAEPDQGEAQGEDGEPIRLSERALALANVATEPVERRSLTREMVLPGRVAVAEDQLHTLSARVSGRLDELHIKITGAEVERGQVVARIYSPELLAVQEELLQAVRLNARQSERSARDKLRLLGIAEQDIAAIEERGEVRDHLPIRATRAGVVLERTVAEGEYVQTGQPLYRLADLSKIWVQLEAFESELPYLSEGQHAHMMVTSGETYHGNIVFIDPVLDDNKRTAQLRLEVDNPERNLKPGMLVRGQVQLPDEPRLVIPAGAPLLTGERALVYVRQPGDTPGFALREITLGPKAGDYYPVLDGLSEGEVVVSQGALRLDSERQIRGMASMMAPEGNGAPAHDHGDDGHSDHDQDHDHGQDHSGHDHRPAESDAPESPDRTALTELFEQYHLGQQALADDRLDDWRRAARSLHDIASVMDWPEELAEQGESLGTGAGELDSVDTLPKAAEIFYHHAQAVIALAERGLAPGPWHIAHCPMADVAGQEGADWLQKDDTLANPYFGHAMLRCGDMRERLEGFHE